MKSLSRSYLVRPKKFPSFKILFITLVLLLSPPIQAQSDSGQSRKGKTALEESLQFSVELEFAPVVVNGEVLFNLVGIPSYPAKKRAAKAGKRIERLALNSDFDPNSLRIVENGLHHEILAGNNPAPVVVIFDQDAELEGINRAIVIEPLKTKIEKIIKAYRHDRKPEVIRANIGRALLRTLLLVVAVFAVLWGFRRLDVLLQKQVKTRIKKLEAKSVRIIQADQLWTIVRTSLQLLQLLIILLLGYVFLNFVLSLFPWTRYIARKLLSYILDPLANMIAAVFNYIPSLIFLLLLLLITRYVLKLLHRFFNVISRGRITFSGFDADWAMPTYRIVRVVVILFAIVLAYPYIPGSQSEAFKGISIMFGVLFSLGSTSVISNVIAGYTMTYRRAFRIGDRVKIGEVTGDVMEMRILVTHIRSLKNEEVIIPNSTILNNEVINYSKMTREHGLILHTTVGIGYEVPWRQVEAMLLQAAKNTADLLTDPKPFVLQTGLADFAVNYELNAYCGDEKQAIALYSELHRNIQDVFNEYGIAIMTPAYEADTPSPKIVPKEKWYAEPAVEPASVKARDAIPD